VFADGVIKQSHCASKPYCARARLWWDPQRSRSSHPLSGIPLWDHAHIDKFRLVSALRAHYTPNTIPRIAAGLAGL
jgi:hypothetical protein